MTIKDVGDAVNLRHEVRNVDGVLTAATVVLTVTKPDGSTSTPTVTSTSTGVYDAAFMIDAKGPWSWKWAVSGAVTDVAYGELSARDPAPPAYVSLTELKDERRIKDAKDDAALQSVLIAASRAIDAKTGRRFWLDPAAVARTINPRGRIVRDDDGERLLVDDIGSTAGLIVEVGAVGGSVWTPVTDFEAGPDDALADGRPITSLLRPLGCWAPLPTSRVRITARWGWPAVPADIETATLLLASRLWFRRDSPQGVAATSEWGPIRVSRLDPDVEALIGPYILPGLA